MDDGIIIYVLKSNQIVEQSICNKSEIVHFALKLSNIVVNFVYGYNANYANHKCFLSLLSDFY